MALPIGQEWIEYETEFTLVEQTTPVTPNTNRIKFYAKDKSGTSALYLKDDAGSEREIAPSTAVTGTGAANRVTFWTGTGTISSDADFTFASDRLTVPDATFSNMTLGSVLFAGTGGALTQDNTNLFWDDSNNRLGVGTNSPSGVLHSFGTAFPVALFERSTTTTDAKVGGTVVKSRSTGDMVDEFGSELLFNIGDAASTSNFIAKIGAKRAGADNTGTFFIDTYNAGTAGERLTISPTGVVNISQLTASRFVTTDASKNLVSTDHTGASDPHTQYLKERASGGAAAEIPDHNHTTTDGMVLTNDEHDGYSEFAVISAPTAPASGKIRLYAFDQNGFPVLEAKGPSGFTRRLVRDGLFVAKCKVAAGVTPGQVVYISGAAGANEEFSLAKADSASTMPAAGLVIDTAAFNDFARIIIAGKEGGLDTETLDNAESQDWNEGDILYVSPNVAGAMTNVAPTWPNVIQRIAIVTRDHATQGELLVNPPGQQNTQPDHGDLAGLADDDHAAYLLASDATNRTTFATNWTDLTDGGETTLHSHTGSGFAGSFLLMGG